MKRGMQHEILIENFRPSRYLMDALAVERQASFKTNYEFAEFCLDPYVFCA